MASTHFYNEKDAIETIEMELSRLSIGGIRKVQQLAITALKKIPHCETCEVHLDDCNASERLPTRMCDACEKINFASYGCDYCGVRSSYDCICDAPPKKHCEGCECYECYTICRDCGKTPHFDTSIKCEVCERVLDCCHTSKDQSDRFCFSCEEAVRSVPNDYEEDYDEVLTWDRDCFYALTLRIGANNNREAEEDTDNVAEKVNCRAEALRLDKIASRLLMNHPSFKPWWIERWNWWGKGAQPSAAAAAAPQPPHSPLKAPAAARPDYRHPHWPSPRAKLFANELSVETKFRKHEDALQFLASRASITVDALLKMSLQQYVKKHNGGRLPAHLRTQRFMSGWGHHDTNY
jgi:hypothetical protein